MNRTYHDSRLKFRAGVALRALALIGAGVGAAALGSAPAYAQDYTSGAITGTVTDDGGKAVSGATVTVTSTDTGTARTFTTGSNGTFRFASLTPGNYDLKVEASGLSPYTATGIQLLASQAATVPVVLTAGGNDIVVTGAKAVQAFSGTTTGLNVSVEDFIKDKPLGRSLQSIILLAPGTKAGNSTNSSFNGLASLGGSSVAENAYYVNGLNITNFDNYLGSATVPFYFYKSVEVKTGGYPAEYGRATGGIINAVTKSGTNEFHAAVHLDWAPDFLRSKSKDTLTFDGTSYVPNTNVDANKSDSLLTAIEASGPIIKDRLFIYGLLQLQNTTSLSNFPNSGIAYRSRNTDPFWGVKLDAYPIDSQHLEFTIFDTRSTTTQYTLPYTFNNGVNAYGGATAVTEYPGGGLNFVGKYTGTLTDWLTVSAAYGRVKDKFNVNNIAAGSDVPYFINASGATTYGVANGGFYTSQRLQTNASPYETERKFFRADADILFTLLGSHHVRVGYDQENNTLDHVSVTTGGAYEYNNGFLSNAAYTAILGGAGVRLIGRAADAGGPIVELNYFNTGGAFKAKNKAYYFEDEWKPTDRLTLSLGVRRDDFRVNKPSGNPIAELNENYAPRVSAEYTLFGDKSGKVFGSYGWYYLPIASNTAFRQGAPSYFFRQRWHYSGVDSKGLPILTSLVTTQGSYQTACPFALVPNGPTTNCSVTGDGADIDTTQGVAHNLKATRESEFILGYEQKVDLWTFRLTYTHRNLDRTAEDSAIDAAVNAYCAANGIVPHSTSTGAATTCDAIFTGYHQYVINNPGQSIVVNLLANGYDINNKEITLTADQLGYGKAKRTYDAVTFSFDRRFNGLWSIGGSYTWSKSLGNSEGYVQSDFGQADSGITQDFDQPGFVPYSYGYLPNDRRHEFKLYGSIAPTENFVFGVNTRVYSAAPLSCFGYNPTDAFANGYGAASHYCNGQPSPRGTAQKSDWVQTIDLSARYKATFGDHVATLRVDVFNLLNSKAVTSRYQFGDLDITTDPATDLPTSYIPDPNYGLPTGYQAPRFVRLGLDISF